MAERTHKDWLSLADLFEALHGGNYIRASEYLRWLCRPPLQQNLPVMSPLSWHAAIDVDLHVAPRMEPHPCVLAVMCPSVALRVAWKRRRVAA